MSIEPLHLAPMPIRLRGCEKYFGGQRVLESMDLDIAAGETVMLLGPSDCGKTTTPRIVVGLEAPDAGGTVHLDDEDAIARPIECRHIGMVLQSYTLLPNLSVCGNIEYGLHIQCRQNGLLDTQISARTNTPLEMMYLTPYADCGVAQLSGRWHQRVALARALASEPHVLLLNEPLTAPDAKLRESVRAEMDRLLCGLGIMAIYVTHDQEEVMALADRIVVMEAGHTAQIGTPRGVYLQPANWHVADFIGIMNRFSGTREDGAPVCAGDHVPVLAGDGNAIFFCPEDAALADSAQAALRGTAESALLLGLRIHVRATGVSATSLSIDVPGRQQFALGHAVDLDISVDRLLALRA